MSAIRSITICIICIFTYFISYSKNNQTGTSGEILQVKYFNTVPESLSPDVRAKLRLSAGISWKFKSIYAKNNGSLSLKKSKETEDYTTLASTNYQNAYATNSTDLAGPANKTVLYELLTKISKKNTADKTYFSQLAFLDSSTMVTIAFTKKESYLLLIDISSNPMQVTSALPVPIINAFNKNANTFGNKELFFIIPETKQIILPVNKTKEKVSKDGSLSWVKTNNTIPGLWIIKPVKNDEKKWIINLEHSEVCYFHTSDKNRLLLYTAHADTKNNIWLSFNNGICGVLPVTTVSGQNSSFQYKDQVVLYNFNKDVNTYFESIKNYKETLYNDLKNTIDSEVQDTISFRKQVYKNPESVANQYLENKKYVQYSNLLRAKEALLDSNSSFENPESLWQYVNLELDVPNSKKKNKTKDFFGYKVRSFQNIQNSITSSADHSVFIVTNLGLYKLSYNEKTNSIQHNWFTTYKNSFLKLKGKYAASGNSTPTYLADKDEVLITDNDFPQVNLLVLDAKNGTLKNKFSLFEHSAGSACENTVAYYDNTLIISNNFGNKNSIHSKYAAQPAAGIMKFNYNYGRWTNDYNWNKLHRSTICNSSVPKISKGGIIYIYHKPLNNYQLSSIRTDKADFYNPIQFSLLPDWKGININDDNYRSNLVIGPMKSAYIGTLSGLLRILTE